jgi:hypothetical protein
MKLCERILDLHEVSSINSDMALELVEYDRKSLLSNRFVWIILKLRSNEMDILKCLRILILNPIGFILVSGYLKFNHN